MQISCALTGNRTADQRLCFRCFLFFLNPKFQDSSLLLKLCSPVCVAPDRKPRRPVFSQRGSIIRVPTFFKGTSLTVCNCLELPGLRISLQCSFGQARGIIIFSTWATKECSDKPAHQRSLNLEFAARKDKV